MTGTAATIPTELLNCPFCGGEAAGRTTVSLSDESTTAHLVNTFIVGCPECNIEFERDTPDDAIAAWNRRASLALVPAGGETLRQTFHDRIYAARFWLSTLGGPDAFSVEQLLFEIDSAALAGSVVEPGGKPLFEIARKEGEEPCGECHLQPGETCDICGAAAPAPPAATPSGHTLEEWREIAVELAFKLGKAEARTAAPQPTEPGGMREGWQRVPVEPTEEMLNKGLFSGAYLRNEIHAYEDPAKVYAAMLAAAPAPPALAPQQPAVAPEPMAYVHHSGRIDPTDVGYEWVLQAIKHLRYGERGPSLYAAPPSSERAGLEPVAWRYDWRERDVATGWTTSFVQDPFGSLSRYFEYRNITPLYATPPARSGLDPATIEACVKWHDERAERHWHRAANAKATGTKTVVAEEERAARIHDLSAAGIRALAQEGS